MCVGVRARTCPCRFVSASDGRVRVPRGVRVCASVAFCAYVTRAVAKMGTDTPSAHTQIRIYASMHTKQLCELSTPVHTPACTDAATHLNCWYRLSGRKEKTVYLELMTRLSVNSASLAASLAYTVRKGPDAPACEYVCASARERQ